MGEEYRVWVVEWRDGQHTHFKVCDDEWKAKGFCDSVKAAGRKAVYWEVTRYPA